MSAKTVTKSCNKDTCETCYNIGTQDAKWGAYHDTKIQEQGFSLEGVGRKVSGEDKRRWLT